MASAVRDSYPLTSTQEGFLFHHAGGAGRGVDVEQLEVTFDEPIDEGDLGWAFQELYATRPELRVAFRVEGAPGAVQEIHDGVAPRLSVRAVAGAQVTDEDLAAFLEEDRHVPFDLAAPPLARVTLLKGESGRGRLVWTFPHIVMDGRAFAPALRDLFALYDARRGGKSVSLPSEARPFREFVHAAASRRRDGDEAFFRSLLAGFRATTPLPWSATGAPDAAARRVERRLSPELRTRLDELAKRHDVSLGAMVLAAWGLVLARHAGEQDVVFGAVRACRRGLGTGFDETIGTCIHTQPVRVTLNENARALDVIRAVRAQSLAMRAHELASLADVQRWSEVPSGRPLFESLVVFDTKSLDAAVRAEPGAWERRRFRLHERTSFPLTLYAYADGPLDLAVAFDPARLDAATAERVLGHVATTLTEMAHDVDRPAATFPMLSPDERALVVTRLNATDVAVPNATLFELFDAQVARTPAAAAVSDDRDRVSYEELQRRVRRLAAALQAKGVGPDVLVGVCLPRRVDMVVAVLAVLAAGGAYVPLDPAYPEDRLKYMLEDCRAAVLLSSREQAARLGATDKVVAVGDDAATPGGDATDYRTPRATPESLAYVLYTSGSTGKPKGVMVEHRNVVNFFVGMDDRLGFSPGTATPGTWLAVTSLSFDISVLELLWTLTRGFHVVLFDDKHRPERAAAKPANAIDFSLFYFSSDESGQGKARYRLLLEGAKFADRHGFAAVWTPERHFHAFGGLYPSPAVVASALAMITERVQLRAGSVVLPLHHPARVAEDWAVVDNLSGGRVGVSFAAGWQPNDFLLRPEAYAKAKNLLFEQLDMVRRLWRGEAVAFPGALGDAVTVTTSPRPVQPELPVWITTAGNVDTYRAAGQAGSFVLTHLLGQTVAEVGEKIRAYRQAWKEAGHAGRGHVTLMLHTFVGDDDAEAKALVRAPMKRYLGSSVSLIKNFAQSFPVFKKAGGEVKGDELSRLSEDEMDALLEYAFERYYETSGLLGGFDRCLAMVERVRAIGVDEIGCLIDFGVDEDRALAHLEPLSRLHAAANAPRDEHTGEGDHLPWLLEHHRVTHLQCTPSLASMLVASEAGRAALRSLDLVMVGGEAFPPALAKELTSLVRGRVLNMYGPTETTIWSSTHEVRGGEAGSIPLGTPIANTRLYVLDDAREPLPVGVAGELYIGGAGVARGYLFRPELTAERFLADPFVQNARIYRTGDLVRRRPDGALEFLGRRDHQVKLRGFRIELGEIEATVAGAAGVREAVVVAREDVPGDVRLVAYVVPRDGSSVQPADVREHVRRTLPDYMVPAHVVLLPGLPRTPNGKTDRKALPAPDRAGALEVAAFVAPTNALEDTLAGIWREVLGAPRVGIDDNFFDLGGHSLLALQVHARVRAATGRTLSITDLFRFPTVRALSRALATPEDDAAPEASRGLDRAEARRQALNRRRGRA